MAALNNAERYDIPCLPVGTSPLLRDPYATSNYGYYE